MNLVASAPTRFKGNSIKNQMMISQKNIEVKDIATYCMVSTSTVRRWLKDDKLKSIKLPSNQYRIRMVDFIDFLKVYNMPVDEEYLNSL